MRSILGLLLLSLVIVLGIDLSSCRHDPFFDMPLPGNTDTSKVDTSTMVPQDTIPQDTMVNVGSGCSPDSVYFSRDVLPVVLSSCAISGCHDDVTHAEGLRLLDYERIVRIVRAGKPENSALYEVLVEDRASKRMPPPPRAALTADQISVIRTWIEQGALNLECTETNACDTTNVSYAGFIQPLINANCAGCHGSINPGAGIQLLNYSQVQNAVNSGRLFGAVAGLQGYVAMPQGGHLDACSIDRIQAWINAGAPNN